MAALVRVLALDVDVPPVEEWARPEVIARAAAFVRDADARRFLAGRWLVASLARELGIGEVVWRCATCGARDHGRPSAPGAGVSTSRCDDVGVVAIGSPDSLVGVDITYVEPPQEAAGIASAMFTTAERALLAAQGPGAFASVWSAKEALGKARGTGLVDPQLDGGPLDSAAHGEWLSGVDGLPSDIVGSLAMRPEAGG